MLHQRMTLRVGYVLQTESQVRATCMEETSRLIDELPLYFNQCGSWLVSGWL